MWASVAAWLTNKAAMIAVCVLALVGVVAGPVALWEAVEINGVTIFGWHVVDGYKAAQGLYEAERAKNKTLQGYYDQASSAAKVCSGQTAAWKKASDAANALATQRLKDLEKERAKTDQLVAEIGAMKPTGDVCKWSLDLMRGQLGK